MTNRTDEIGGSGGTFLRQAFFDLIFAAEIVGMVAAGWRSELHDSDPVWNLSLMQ